MRAMLSRSDWANHSIRASCVERLILACDACPSRIISASVGMRGEAGIRIPELSAAPSGDRRHAGNVRTRTPASQGTHRWRPDQPKFDNIRIRGIIPVIVPSEGDQMAIGSAIDADRRSTCSMTWAGAVLEVQRIRPQDGSVGFTSATVTMRYGSLIHTLTNTA